MSKKLGTFGEQKALQYLLNKGFKLIDKNYRGTKGEVDLIVRKDKVLSFVEVKTWKSVCFEDLEYGINKKKQSRIIHAAREYLVKHDEYLGMEIQFDVVYINPSEGRFVYIPSAYGAE